MPAGVMLAAAKHQVLKQVSIAALALLRLVTRTGLHHDVERDQIRIICRHGDYAQTIWQIVDRVIVGKRFARFLLSQSNDGQAEN